MSGKAKAYDQLTDVTSEKAAMVAHPEVGPDETPHAITHFLPGVDAGRARRGDEAIGRG
jgi:hypothetical protein